MLFPKKYLITETLGQTDQLNEDEAAPHMNKPLAHVLCLMLTFVVCAKGNDSRPSWPRRTQREQSEELTSGATTASQG